MRAIEAMMAIGAMMALLHFDQVGIRLHGVGLGRWQCPRR
jgi:hypothetical protein